MNKCPHEFESEIQTPLLLRYKIRNCQRGMEAFFNTNADELFGCWNSYEESKTEIWHLKFYKSWEFMLSENQDKMAFFKYKIHAAGDPNPIIIWFDQQEKYYNSQIFDIYRLPENYEIGRYESEWRQQINLQLTPILQEYERNHGDWETRVIVNKLRKIMQ